MFIKNATKNTLTLLCMVMLGMVFLPVWSFAFQRGNEKAGVAIKLQPTNPRAKFTAKRPVKYKISFTNNLKTDQEGTIVYTIENQKGEAVLTNSLDVRVNAKKILSSSFEIPLDIEGAYKMTLNIDLSDYTQAFTEEFSYSGPPIKAKDRKNIINPYSTPSFKDNLINGVPTENQSLVTDEEGEAPPPEEPEEELEGEILTVLKSNKVDGIYYNKKDIKYEVTITNKYKVKQEGTFTFMVETEKGTPVWQKEVKLNIRRKGIKKFHISAPELTDPGVYNIKAAVNTTTYDDTSRLAFGYQINKIATPFYLPPDFDDFWKKAMDELASVDPQYKIERSEEFSTRYHDVYRVDMMSLGNIPIFGYLSVPKLKGKYPVIIGYGGYKKDVNPLLFGEFISFAVNVRGLEKNTIELINPEHKEQIVVNIENKDEYIYRGIYMDCIRAVDFIFSHADLGMDINRVVAFGGSQGATLGLITAALLPGKINSVVASNPVFADWKNSYAIGKSKPRLTFPTNALTEHLAKDKNFTTEDLLQTLNYYDLQNFMPKIRCSVLYAVGLLDEFIPPGSALAAYNKMSPTALEKSELFVFPKLGHEIPQYHNSFIGIWFGENTVKKSKK